MSCYHPKLAYMGYSPKHRKNHLFFNWQSLPQSTLDNLTPVQIPCRTCVGCRSDYAKQWAIRCQLEAQTTIGDCWFLTLTYDEDHLPVSRVVTTPDDDGCVDSMWCPSLRKRDLQLFFKRLRKKCGKFRYFCCGEYGAKYGRPHYHCIIFGLTLSDLELYSNKNGVQLYTSAMLSDTWSAGNVIFSRYEYATGAYVAKYVSKNMMDCDGWQTELDAREKPFLLMSRRPGIGRQYFDDHKSDIVLSDCVYVNKSDKISAVQPPKYYDYLINNIDPGTSNMIKSDRRASSSSDPLDVFDRLANQRRLAKEKIILKNSKKRLDI